jgi:hypothetical protein
MKIRRVFKKYKLNIKERKQMATTVSIKEAMLAGSGNFIQQEGYYSTWKQELNNY